MLIFDEVITGFRLGLGGATGRFGVTPDLATYGKALAGSWPVGALAGRRELMEPFGSGTVNHSGTFNANVMAMAAVTATLKQLRDEPPYEQIERIGGRLMKELGELGLRIQGTPMAFHATFADDDATSAPVPPLARATDWVEVTLDIGEGTKTYRRETNTMPNWAGSCWYELRYLDPTNDKALVDPENERYWMGPRFDGDCGGVDLYVGGAEHAVLHLLYARFWHKVLYDLGHVSSFEPYKRLFNQGMIQAAAYTDDRGMYVDAHAVVERDGGFWHDDQPVRQEFGKMGKSLRNAVTPDEMYASYGADTLRLYEMFTGPLDQSRPWDTKAVVGVFRLLQRIWRNVVDEDTGAVTVGDDDPDDETTRLLHRTIDAVRDGMENLRFNVSIARITELNNHLTARHPDGGVPRSIVEPLVLLLAPLAPHVSEELWSRLGHPDSLSDEPFPEADPALLVDGTVEIPVQVNGKVRARVQVPVDADASAMEAAARADDKMATLLDGATVRRVIAVPGRLVNFVVG